MKFSENPSSGSRDVSCGRNERTDRWTDIKKLIVTFCNFANSSKMISMNLNFNAVNFLLNIRKSDTLSYN